MQTSLRAAPGRRPPRRLQIVSHHFENNDIVAAGDRFAFRRGAVINRDATELALQLLHHLGKPLPRKRLTCLVRKRQKDFDEIGQRKCSSLGSKRSGGPRDQRSPQSWKAAIPTEMGHHAAFWLTMEVASFVSSWSVLISSCRVSFKIIAASFMPSCSAQVRNVPYRAIS